MRKLIWLFVLMLVPSLKAQVSKPVPTPVSAQPSSCPIGNLYQITPGHTGAGNIYGNSGTGTTCALIATGSSGGPYLPLAGGVPMTGATGCGTVTAGSLCFADPPTVTGAPIGGGKWSCQPGIGDGLNVIATGTYLQTTCYNDTGGTVTLTGIKCFADVGSPTFNVTNGAGSSLLTGPLTCTSSYASGTQSGTITLASGDYLKFSFVAVSGSTQIGGVVTGTY